MSMEMALRRAGLLNVSQPIEPCFSAMDALGQLARREGRLFVRATSSALGH